MNRVTLQTESLRAVLDPDMGAGVADLSLRAPSGDHFPLWRRAPDRVTHFNELASYTLAPWCNRIAAGSFTFEGRRIEVPPDWKDGTAIHGLVKDKPFTLLDRSPVSARFRFDSRRHAGLPWPWPFTCTTRYELDETALIHDVSLTNHAASPMPAGIGFHPYFARALWDPRDEVAVHMNVSGRYPCTAMIPNGPARPDEVTDHFAQERPLGTLDLDDVFAGFDGRATITWPASRVRARFECAPDFGHSVVYSPVDRTGADVRPLPHFCLEPVSMVNDGFNLLSRGQTGTGVRTLAPGESMNTRFRLVIERL